MDKEAPMDKEDPEEEKIISFAGSKYLVIFVILCAVVVLIILGAKYFVHNAALTLEEQHAANYQAKATDHNYIYNGFSFLKLKDPRTTTEFWYTQYQKNGQVFDIPFHYGPKELEDIPIVVLNRTNATLPDVFISIMPDENKSMGNLAQAVYEITEKMVKILDLQPVAACQINATKACSERPIVTCQNTQDAVVIELKEAPEPKIIVHDNCILILGKDEDLLRAGDKLIYLYLKIVE